jgi:hypothetical protein
MGNEWLFTQQEEWYRRSSQLLSLYRDEGCFFMLLFTVYPAAGAAVDK